MGPLKATVIVLLVTLLAGCVTTPAPVADPKQVWCDHNEPRRTTAASRQAMTRAELEELVTFNRQGADWCGWSP